MVTSRDPSRPPFDARAISNLILDRADDLKINIYVTTLLKVLYFSHGWHLARFSEPLIGQSFEAWQHGPVVRVVYDQVKDLSGKKIDRRLNAFDPATARYTVATCNPLPGTIELLTAVLRSYGTFHPYTLSEMTHEAGSPWDVAWEAAQKGERPGARLNDGDIRVYFLRLNQSDVLRS
jgi:uncharacterized phage-associated protein